MKICLKCQINKSKTLFHKDKRKKDGLRNYCKKCVSTYNSIRYLKNPKKYKDSTKARYLLDPSYYKNWKLENLEKISLSNKTYYLANLEKIKANSRAWTLANLERAKINNRNWYLTNTEGCKTHAKIWRLANLDKCNAIAANRRSKKLKATPAWANTEFEKLAMQEMYAEAKKRTKETSIKYHVDHIVPLNSKIVQGFHCLANLQIIEAKENISKGNRTWPNMP